LRQRVREVIEASNGREALKRAGMLEPDVVLTEIVMLERKAWS